MMILVADPYRSGTGDDPAKLAANVNAMNQAALDLFRAGHLPVTGEAHWRAIGRRGHDGRTALAQGKQVFTSIDHIPG